MEIKVEGNYHEKYAIESIDDSSVAWNQIGKILNMIIYTFISRDLFRPDAKKPPKGPSRLAYRETKSMWAVKYEI